jgi:hypothetical protein
VNFSRARSFTALAALVASTLLGCGSSHAACPGGCAGPGFADFVLACSPSDLVSVNVTGPCLTGDAGLASYFTGSGRSTLTIDSLEAGTCHVQLEFASGYAYASDVQFTQQTNNVPPGCPCSTYVVATQQTFQVDNPASTCSDAGGDASGD